MDVERECKVDQTHKDDELLIELDMVRGCVVDIGVVINLVSLIEWYEANYEAKMKNGESSSIRVIDVTISDECVGDV